jgi:hypothetical protein
MIDFSGVIRNMLWERLPQSKRDDIIKRLNDRQREFVTMHLKRGRKTVFSNILAKDKASSVHDRVEEVADSWEFVDYIDFGTVSSAPEHRCECGRALRYQYIVKNTITGEVKKFGIQHFREHTQIPAHLVKEILKGIEKIDYELDEILIKVESRWTLEGQGIKEIPAEIDIPQDIQEHFSYDVPLLDRQVTRLRQRINDYKREQARLREQREREAFLKRQHTYVQESGPPADQQAASTQRLSTKLEHNYRQIVLLYTSEHQTLSAKEVTIHLIRHHGAPSDTFIGGRPKMYPLVCMFLDELAAKGILRLKEKVGMEDRIYSVINGAKIDIPADNSVAEIEQLTLFDK